MTFQTQESLNILNTVAFPTPKPNDCFMYYGASIGMKDMTKRGGHDPLKQGYFEIFWDPYF